ncbi:hypothetical protein M5D96_009221 [Drosophila gunungcola]|uniref:Uncharacterized protein n=1 Tax=Drosophila gunungcola TaxID=103775 RepID=A0A9P9YIS6_9MUSC|nr:hypothetical protein M5D96_009221 [Drosophila gunungcola]
MRTLNFGTNFDSINLPFQKRCLRWSLNSMCNFMENDFPSCLFIFILGIRFFLMQKACRPIIKIFF